MTARVITTIGSRILHNHGWVYHHADRYEEDGAEQVLDRLHQALYALRLYRLGKNGAHDERAESSREPRMCAAITTIPGNRVRERLSARFPRSSASGTAQSGDEVYPHHEPKYQEEQRFGNAPQHLRTLEVMADCHRGEHHHQYDGKNILQDKHTEHQPVNCFLRIPKSSNAL